jgi:hypothetical protein
MHSSAFDIAKILPLLVPILLIQFGLQIYAIVDLSRRSPQQVRGGNKWLWVAIIIAGEILGPIAYVTLGRTEE